MALVRQAAVAGTFYPEDPTELRSIIEVFLDEVRDWFPPARVKGIIVPHAGYVYSGLTAAHAYAALKQSTYTTVAILAPSHWDLFPGVSVYPGTAYETPLGPVPVDEALREELLAECDVVFATDAGHRAEHALEVQLPFLQYVVGTFSLLPLVLGEQTREVCFSLAEALARVLKRRDTLLVASTDLSHYYPAQIAAEKDGRFRRCVTQFDPELLMSEIEKGTAEACGAGPTVTVMAALRSLGARHMHELHYAHSGNVSGDYQRVVGYLAAAAT